jgi:hypothetical protein
VKCKKHPESDIGANPMNAPMGVDGKPWHRSQ